MEDTDTDPAAAPEPPAKAARTVKAKPASKMVSSEMATPKPKRGRPPLTPHQKGRKLYEQGYDVRQVAAELGVSYGTALWWSKNGNE